MRFLLSLFLVISIVSCNPPIEDNRCQPDQDALINTVRNRTCRQLKAEKELYACGVGAGGRDNVRMIALSFFYYKELNLEQARELLMTAIDSLINNINADDQIRPFLIKYPFPPENIQIRIFINEPKNCIKDHEKLSVVSMIDGILKYKTEDPKTNLVKTIHSETYAEATEKLKEAVATNSS